MVGEVLSKGIKAGNKITSALHGESKMEEICWKGNIIIVLI